MRAVAHIAASDVHPLIVPRVRNFLSTGMGLDEPAKLRFIQHWFSVGSEALEAKHARDPETGAFAHGDSATLADLVLAFHVVGARLFKTNLSEAPKLTALVDRCLTQAAFDPGRLAQGH